MTAKPRKLARLADITEATVSRLVSGSRKPSIRMMGQIERAMGWKIGEQATAYARGSYADELAKKLEKWNPPAEDEAPART